MGVSGSELEALILIDKHGGEARVQLISQKMNIDTNYARLICTSLAKADYIDLFGRGICHITPKGRATVEKKRR